MLGNWIFEKEKELNDGFKECEMLLMDVKATALQMQEQLQQLTTLIKASVDSQDKALMKMEVISKDMESLVASKALQDDSRLEAWKNELDVLRLALIGTPPVSTKDYGTASDSTTYVEYSTNLAAFEAPPGRNMESHLDASVAG